MASSIHGDLCRVRIHLDFPSVSIGRKSWLLFDPSQCRLVSDLAHLIRTRYQLTAPISCLHLLMDGYDLPLNESVRLIRDNDTIHVSSVPSEQQQQPATQTDSDSHSSSDSSVRATPRKVPRPLANQTIFTPVTAVSSSTETSSLSDDDSDRAGTVPVARGVVRGTPVARGAVRGTPVARGAVRGTPAVKIKGTSVAMKRTPVARGAGTGTARRGTSSARGAVRGTLVAKGAVRGTGTARRGTSTARGAVQVARGAARGALVARGAARGSKVAGGAARGTLIAKGVTGNKVPIKTDSSSKHIHFSSSSSDSAVDTTIKENPELPTITTDPVLQQSTTDHSAVSLQEDKEESTLEITASTVQEAHKDYSLLPALSSLPAIGDQIAFRMIELSPAYTPVQSEYKEGHVKSFNMSSHSLVIRLNETSYVKEKSNAVRHSEGKFALPDTEPVEPAREIELKFNDLIEPKILE